MEEGCGVTGKEEIRKGKWFVSTSCQYIYFHMIEQD